MFLCCWGVPMQQPCLAALSSSNQEGTVDLKSSNQHLQASTCRLTHD